MKAINRTHALRSGQEIPHSGGKVTLYETAPGGQRKIRCPKCGGIAIPTRAPNGKSVAICNQCQTCFTSVSM